MCIYHFFLIQSSVHVHLGCFHVLATVNSAEINKQVQVFFLRKILSGYIPKSWMLGHIVVLCIDF